MNPLTNLPSSFYAMSFAITISLFFCLGLFLIANAETINLPLAPITGPIQGPYQDSAITVSLSNSCLTSLKLNYTTCPSNDILKQLDTSKTQSGTFQIIDGITQRKQNNLANEERLYSFDNNPIIIDPSFRLQIKFKTIYIVPSLDNYLKPDSMKKENNTRITYKDLAVDDRCRTATISASEWQKTLPNAISYLRSNCNDKFILLEYRDITVDKITEIDITTTASYKYNKWLEEAKKSSKSTFLIK